MATWNIAPQSPSWPSPTQYIEPVIAGGSAGDTYVLQAGIHRLQHIKSLRSGDTVEFAPGAEMWGSEPFGTSGWTNNGDGTWWKVASPSLTRLSSNNNCRSGYDCRRLEWLIIDNDPKAWVSSQGAVSAQTAWYNTSNNRAYIGVNPSTVSTIEIARQERAITDNRSGGTTNVTIKAQDRVFPGVIRNYAPTTQPPNAGIALGSAQSPSNQHGPGSDWLMQDMEITGFSGTGISWSDRCIMRRCTVHHMGQSASGTSGTGKADQPSADLVDDAIIEYSEFYENAVGGWNVGWEGGNSKYVRSRRMIVRGSHYWIGDHPVSSSTGAIWFDIDSDGADIYANIGADYSTVANKTNSAIFWEINQSAKIHHNIHYYTARGTSTVMGWYKNPLVSNSGVPPANPSEWEYPYLYIEDNRIYKSHGGVGCVDNGLRGDERHCDRLRTNRNIVHMDSETAPGTVGTGFVNFQTGLYTLSDNDAQDNLYYLPNKTSGNFSNQQSGGSGANKNWTTWQGDGMDTNGEIITERSAPWADPNPLNGQCMVGGV